MVPDGFGVRVSDVCKCGHVFETRVIEAYDEDLMEWGLFDIDLICCNKCGEEIEYKVKATYRVCNFRKTHKVYGIELGYNTNNIYINCVF